jgi:uncharacterized protein
VDRRTELADLLRVIKGDRPALVRLYGRRRIGKTELLRELNKRVKGIFLLADEADRPQQLESLSRQLAEATKSLRMPLRDWDDLFDQVEASKTPLIIIDEFQRLLEADRQAATRLQARWDERWQKKGPSVIVCGSSIGMMQRLTGGRRGPLFGRLSADLRLRAFSYAPVRLLYPDLAEDERIRRYAVFGGTPFYHALSPGRSLRDAVFSSFLDATAPFREEPQELLRTELKSPARYNSVLYEIGQGTHYLGELESKAAVKKGGLGPYLEALKQDLDLVEMEDPVCGVRKQARYHLADPFFAFYYRFVFANRPKLELGRADLVWNEIKSNLEGHVGRVFERVVKTALQLANGSKVGGMAADFDQIGRWWSRSGQEIDVVARGPKEIWAAEVSWSDRAATMRDWTTLIQKIPLMERTDGKPVRPVLVQRGGFTPDVKAEASRTGGVLLDLGDLTAIFEKHPV